MKKIITLSLVWLLGLNFAFSQEAYLGEIRLMSTGFAPKGWAICSGQLLPINQNQALFSILGTTYGGNGTTNFALPDFRGRVAVGQGNGMQIGEQGGSETVTLNATNIPAHSHFEPVQVSGVTSTESIPTASARLASLVVIINNAPKTALGYTSATPNVTLAGGTQTTTNGGTQSAVLPITNVQPYLALTYMIALQGIFPSQN